MARDVLVDPSWLAARLGDPGLRLIEVHLEPGPYDEGHIAGALSWPALTTILGPDYRTRFDPAEAGELLGRSGIAEDTTVVVYSDHPALAPWVLWYLETFGHHDVRVLEGGRRRWVAEGHPLTTEVPRVDAVERTVAPPDPSRRALLDRVRAAVEDPGTVLLDVRTPEEWRGETFLIAPPGPGERGGHIPGATHLYYEEAMNDDGTFKGDDELTALFAAHGITPDRELITYCAVGMRSAHAWFVLSRLLGWERVRSYDGSWNEWGRLPDTPIVTGA
jgi:thiosulfate/3-mercaptopyruvate sulfurtransferase